MLNTSCCSVTGKEKKSDACKHAYQVDVAHGGLLVEQLRRLPDPISITQEMEDIEKQLEFLISCKGQILRPDVSVDRGAGRSDGPCITAQSDKVERNSISLNLTNQQKRMLMKLMGKFVDAFRNQLSCTNAAKIRIIIGDTSQVHMPPYRLA